MTKRALSEMPGDMELREEPIGETTWKIPKVDDSEDDYHSVSTSSSTPPPFSPGSTSAVNQNSLEVTCGNLTGILHMEHFMCPGIREKCISTTDAPGELLTPVEFTIKADKIRQKDWKGAIKHQGKMLRVLMEYKQLDFFNHSATCSYKCHSRNYITKANNMEQRPKRAPRVPKTTKPDRPLQCQPSLANVPTSNQLAELMKNPDVIAYLAAQMCDNVQKRQGEAEKYRKAKQDAIKNLLVNDPATFWTQIFRSNLIQSVMSAMTANISQQVNNMTAGRNFAESSNKLSQILQVLGVTEKLTDKICGHFVMPPNVRIDVAGEPSTSSASTTPSIIQSNEQISQFLQNIQNSQTPPPPLQSPSPNRQNCSTPILLNLLEGNNNNNNLNNQTPLTSSEKLEMMVKQISP